METGAVMPHSKIMDSSLPRTMHQCLRLLLTKISQILFQKILDRDRNRRVASDLPRIPINQTRFLFLKKSFQALFLLGKYFLLSLGKNYILKKKKKGDTVLLKKRIMLLACLGVSAVTLFSGCAGNYPAKVSSS